MHRAALHVTPTLVKYAAKNPYRAGVGKAVTDALRRVYTPPESGAGSTMVVTQPVRLVRHDKDALERIALALVYDGADPAAHASGVIDGLRNATSGSSRRWWPPPSTPAARTTRRRAASRPPR